MDTRTDPSHTAPAPSPAGTVPAVPFLAALLSAVVLTAGAIRLIPRLPVDFGGEYFRIDRLGGMLLLLTAAIFLACTIASYGYFRREIREGKLTPARTGAAYGWILLFVLSMAAGICAHHLALQWVALEATTLCTTPLIYLHGDRKATEAAWKYLLICSVGIAFAFLGLIFLYRAAGEIPMTWSALKEHAAELDPRSLRFGFAFLLVGYGTKMGLAPMHTWLPDAHSQAPAPVSAMLSGVLLNCALLSILRVLPAVPESLSGPMLVLFGLASIGVPALLAAVQRDVKRLLAYSSIENMGIVALGLGFGGTARTAALLHVINHSLAKVVLFLVAGDLIFRFGTQRIREIRGALRLSPAAGALWFAGILAIGGSPPFGSFWSELGILAGGIGTGRYAASMAYLVLLAVMFGSFLMYGSTMIFGEPEVRGTARGERLCLIPAGALLLCSLALGLHVPSSLYGYLETIAAALAFPA